MQTWWEGGQPSRAGHCVHVEKFGDGVYLWANQDCEREQAFVCQVSQTGECHGTVREIGQVSQTGECHGTVREIGQVSQTGECWGTVRSVRQVSVGGLSGQSDR